MPGKSAACCTLILTTCIPLWPRPQTNRKFMSVQLRRRLCGCGSCKIENHLLEQQNVIYSIVLIALLNYVAQLLEINLFPFL